jgi:predicted phosphodiesterase
MKSDPAFVMQRLAPSVATMRDFEKWVILPDVHRPFHNETLWVKVLQYIRDVQPYGVILGGDYLDLYTLGRWNKGSLARLKDLDLGYEYDDGKKGIDELEEVLPAGCARHYLFGNHEDRFFRFVEDTDNAKLGGALRHPADALGLWDRGWTVHENWKDGFVQLGEYMQVMHGQYTNKYAAAKHLQEFKTSVIFGHSHRFQAHYDGRDAAFNIGFLGDKNSDGFLYVNRAIREGWVNGFCTVDISSDGHSWFEPHQVYNDRFKAGGRFY